uniref:Uncharacterized protein n=1 Tax=Bicosoecida sp. CB-2014 TaxID=1486930 RepID=A0A7S1C261_9STRA|mmetsp:Transcript_1095/g.3474  ORF Transcript_1095/g.3474 Transcript_1095/m.3474 type:complete len:257 (+) Transcript_1095:485-1255(+)
MEEYDELLQKPDDHGLLDMSHRAWRIIDKSVFGWADTLITLNVSFNDLPAIPKEIGLLSLLQELNAASNEIETLPDEIGKCQRLTTLKIANNKLDELPRGLGDCKNLEHIFAANNRIQALPDTIGKLSHLVTLSVPSNKLQRVPLSLFNCTALEIVDFTSNPELEMIPDELRTNTPMVLWICRQFQLKQDVIDELRAANDDLEHLTKLGDDERLEMRKEMVSLRKRNRDLLDREPKLYMKVKLGVKGCASRVCTIQ